MRPGPAAQAPAQHLGDRAQHAAADSIRWSQPAARRSRIFPGSRRPARRTPDRHAGCRYRMPARRFRQRESPGSACCRPACCSRSCATGTDLLSVEPHARDALLPLHEGQRRGRDLHDIGAALGIEQVGAAELMRKCLAIIAVADHAIDRLRRSVGRPPRPPPRTGIATPLVCSSAPPTRLPRTVPGIQPALALHSQLAHPLARP